ncbi:hypothetical protein TRAPUB_476 [Trametes pubescens]|uniref:Uncharacterized protein n=1 Tax=Trametes pubescens TaxID=154538 RepID=A0A1M2VM17_TRAPU|nr:hypothetical protein TRAPUB_476 [Trametes pubescens]
MPTSPNARARESNSRPYPASPSSAATRRSTRPRQAPSLPSTPVVLDERVYKVPLPRDTDLGWKLQALVDDKSGLSLVPGGPLQDVVDQRVHLASYGLEHYFPEGFIYMQRAYFAAEIQPPPFPSRPFRRKEGGITLGYVLENLVNQQLKAWRSSVQLDLRRIVGDHAPPGVLVRASSVYIVRIRRRRSANGGPWCFFPELEVRL